MCRNTCGMPRWERLLFIGEGEKGMWGKVNASEGVSDGSFTPRQKNKC